MAFYKYTEVMHRSSDAAFDRILESGAYAPWPGIYRCEPCGREVAIAAADHALPTENHHQHRPDQGPIRWRLVVSHGRN